MRCFVALVLFAIGCGSSNPYDLRITATLTVTPTSGSGSSPLEVLDDQTITVEVTFVNAGRGYDNSIPSCADTSYEQIEPTKVATGAMPELVTSDILMKLPDWIATLELCTPSSGSSAQIRSDNEAGLALTVGCHDLPQNAQGLDGAGHPVWTSVELSSNCDATLYDQLNGRLFGGTNVAMSISN